MTAKYKAQYEHVCKMLVEFIEEQRLFNHYPLTVAKLEEIIVNNGWRLKQYTDFDQNCNISQEGFTTYENGIFTIHYNWMMPDERKCFTLGHEIGHIILNHHVLHKKDLICNNSEVIDELEKEANCFCRNLLAPSKVILELQKYIRMPLDKDDIKKVFNVSGEFSKNRLGWVFKKDVKYCNFENPNLFDSFIEESKPKVDYHIVNNEDDFNDDEDDFLF